MNDILSHHFQAALIALEPMSYLIRFTLASAAFGAAMATDKVIARVIGIAGLLVTCAVFLIIGTTKGTVVDIVLGLAAGGAAVYSWWHTR